MLFCICLLHPQLTVLRSSEVMSEALAVPHARSCLLWRERMNFHKWTDRMVQIVLFHYSWFFTALSEADKTFPQNSFLDSPTKTELTTLLNTDPASSQLTNGWVNIFERWKGAAIQDTQDRVIFEIPSFVFFSLLSCPFPNQPLGHKKNYRDFFSSPRVYHS